MTSAYRYRVVGRSADGKDWATPPMEGAAAKGDACARARHIAEDDSYQGTVNVQVQTVTYSRWRTDPFTSPPFSGPSQTTREEGR